MTQWFKPATLPVADEHMAGNYSNLVGACIGPEDYTYRMLRPITGADFPPNMEAEGRVMDTIFTLRDQEVAPTRLNIIQLMSIKYPYDEVVRVVDACIKAAGDEPIRREAVRECSARIAEWMQDMKGRGASNSIKEIMYSPFADYSFKYDEARKALERAAPLESVVEYYDEKRLFDLWLRDQYQGYADVQSGLQAGLNLPWEASRAFISRLKWNETTMLLGKEGSGKTSLGLDVAESVAWRQKIKTDVIMIRTETDPMVIQTRWFARHSLIPFKALDSYEVDLKSEKWMPKVEQWRAMRNRNSELYGHVHVLWMPEARVEQVVSEMEKCVRVSAEAGRKCLFVVDYLQAFNWWDYDMKQNTALEMIGMRLAGTNRRLKSHLFLIAQEGSNEGEAFGSTIPRKISQIVLSIKREEFDGGRAQMDGKQVVDASGVPQKDALGNPRYLHRKGDKFGSYVEIGISKANDAPTQVIKGWFEGAYNILHPDREQIKELRDKKLLPPEGK